MGLYKLILLVLSTFCTCISIGCGMYVLQHPYGKLAAEHVFSQQFRESQFFQTHTMFMMVFSLAFGACCCLLPANAPTARASFMASVFALGAFIYMHFVAFPGTIPNILTKDAFQVFLGILAFTTLVGFFFGFVQRSPSQSTKEKRN